MTKYNKLENLPEGLTYDDVLLLPGYTDFKREVVDTSVTLAKDVFLPLPLFAAPMDTITETNMAIAFARQGGLGVIHRNLSVEKQADMIAAVKKAALGEGNASRDTNGRLLVSAAVGTGSDLHDRIVALEKAGVDVLMIDSGHGNTSFIIDALKTIKELTHIPVVAGNIATADAATRLIEAGADVLKVGMGPGSICTTRIVTGMGVPQLTAVSNVCEIAQKTNTPVIADGGIKQIGDIAKSLAVGACGAMVGSLVAGYSQTPGDIITLDNVEYKQYRGMGSVSAMKEGGAERYGQNKDENKKKLIAEGVESLVKSRGDVEEFLFQIRGALRSSFYYIGAKNYAEFVEKAQFIRITQSSLLESHPHTVQITGTGDTYIA